MPSKRVSESRTSSARIIRRYLTNYPGLRSRIIQDLLIRLHEKGLASVDEIYREALGKTSLRNGAHRRQAANVDSAVAWNGKDRTALQRTVIAHAAKVFTPDEVEDVVGAAAKREEAQNLEDLARLPGVSFAILKRKLEDFCRLPLTETPIPPSAAVATRVALLRQIVSDHMDFLGVARDHVTIRDLNEIAGRMIGPDEGVGRIGGKAAGLVLANKILEGHFRKTGREPLLPMATPESFYLRSDLHSEFVRRNGLKAYSAQKYKTQAEIEADFPLVHELFHAGKFPAGAVARIKRLLERLGPVPLIVRSSSLLEDSLGAAFSGKYSSIFLANQGRLQDRLKRFMSAVAEVYSSVLSPDPLLYRRERDLLEYDEFMAILVQPVIGRRHGDYFFPLYAGVAFSQNDYFRWNPRIHREDGFVRLVAGLGTRAVDRVSSEYPRMVALSVPSLRPQGDAAEIRRQSQRNVDVVNLKTNAFETLSVAEVVGSEPPPGFNLIASIVEDDGFKPILGDMVDPTRQEVCLTFDHLVESTPFSAHMREALKVLEEAYGCPVDIEFASDGSRFYLLQCRPLAKLIESRHVRVPTDVEPSRVLFGANRDVRNGLIENIEYLVWIPVHDYDAVGDFAVKQAVGRVVGQINQKLEESSFVLMGPGRWGSTDINLGVRVKYADIRNACALIEIARERDGYVPEVSFGTHFFQDLVEAGIVYLPLYPDDPAVPFNEDFLRGAKNALGSLCPDRRPFENLVKVIHVPEVTGGLYAHLAMNGESERALCYLGPRVV